MVSLPGVGGGSDLSHSSCKSRGTEFTCCFRFGPSGSNHRPRPSPSGCLQHPFERLAAISIDGFSVFGLYLFEVLFQGVLSLVDVHGAFAQVHEQRDEEREFAKARCLIVDIWLDKSQHIFDSALCV